MRDLRQSDCQLAMFVEAIEDILRVAQYADGVNRRQSIYYWELQGVYAAALRIADRETYKILRWKFDSIGEKLLMGNYQRDVDRPQNGVPDGTEIAGIYDAADKAVDAVAYLVGSAGDYGQDETIGLLMEAGEMVIEGARRLSYADNLGGLSNKLDEAAYAAFRGGDQ